MSVLSISNIHKHFGGNTVLDGINMEIDEGKIYDNIWDWKHQAPTRIHLDPYEILAALRHTCEVKDGLKGSSPLKNFVHAICNGEDGEDALQRMAETGEQGNNEKSWE